MPRITPFLWFDREAEEAANFYVAVFPNSEILETTRFPEAGQEIEGRPPPGSVMAVRFSLDGQEYTALNGGPGHPFNDSISFVVPCETQEEIDHYWERLGDGGRPIQCGWLTDRFGLTWQIVPSLIGELLRGPDPAARERAMQAMLGMVKLDIERLEKARQG